MVASGQHDAPRGVHLPDIQPNALAHALGWWRGGEHLRKRRWWCPPAKLANTSAARRWPPPAKYRTSVVDAEDEPGGVRLVGADQEGAGASTLQHACAPTQRERWVSRAGDCSSRARGCGCARPGADEARTCASGQTALHSARAIAQRPSALPCLSSF